MNEATKDTIFAAILAAGATFMVDVNGSIAMMRERVNKVEEVTPLVSVGRDNQRYNRERLRALEQRMSTDEALSKIHTTRLDLMLTEIQRLREIEVSMRCGADGR